jgi:prephenate dehydrogenase
MFGIVGFGQFGRFMAKHLSRVGDVYAYNRSQVSDVPEGVEMRTLAEVCACPYVILCVPMSSFESICETTQHLIPRTSVVIDVTSVKVPPIALMKKYFPEHQVLGTHPVFGPQSGKDGIEGLTIVLCNVSTSEEVYASIKQTCSEIFKLVVVETTPEQHDEEMAYVQGLTHFIGRALAEMNIADSPLATKSYTQLVNLVKLVGTDSWELFKTIEDQNPSASGIRAAFLKQLHSLEDRLSRN